MAKFTSYHLKGGQLFYAKTGASVPVKYATNLTVDLAKKTVYKDGRKVGTLRQKTLSKKASVTIDRNIKRRPRVPAVDMDAVRGGKPKGLDSAPAEIKVDLVTQDVVNFNKAVDELARLGRLQPGDAQSMKDVYKIASKSMRIAMWDDVHSMFDEYGYQYETVGWID